MLEKRLEIFFYPAEKKLPLKNNLLLKLFTVKNAVSGTLFVVQRFLMSKLEKRLKMDDGKVMKIPAYG